MHAAAAAALDLLANPLKVDLIFELEVEPLHVELESLRVGSQLVQLQVILIFEQQVVHRPKLALCARRLGRLRRNQGMRMDPFKWKVSKYDAQPVPKMGQLNFHCRRRLLAVGTLKVAIFNQCDMASLSPQDMVGFVRRDCEFK